MLEKYVGRTVEIIYQDRKGQFTKRRVRVQSIKEDRAKVFCMSAGGSRVLIVNSILAVQPVSHRVG